MFLLMLHILLREIGPSNHFHAQSWYIKTLFFFWNFPESWFMLMLKAGTSRHNFSIDIFRIKSCSCSSKLKVIVVVLSQELVCFFCSEVHWNHIFPHFFIHIIPLIVGWWNQIPPQRRSSNQISPQVLYLEFYTRVQSDKAAVNVPDFDTLVPAPELSLPIGLCRHISKRIIFCIGATALEWEWVSKSSTWTAAL